jgi:hypothetical protein
VQPVKVFIPGNKTIDRCPVRLFYRIREEGEVGRHREKRADDQQKHNKGKF